MEHHSKESREESSGKLTSLSKIYPFTFQFFSGKLAKRKLRNFSKRKRKVRNS
ncbi:unnamed protein product [Ceutorhynchus assimilis]|uniref:Uncharacterized protein n=1 Tax=Ceutorhynchus assimilis TaxID=467358 RepID=A0A9N9N129_9CUCU|nr:unnamed protein product [Ceutorhynchus assimilis]